MRGGGESRGAGGGVGRLAAPKSPTYGLPPAVGSQEFYGWVAWAVALPSSLVTMFKTRGSFRAGQGPSDISSLACGLHCQRGRELPLHPAWPGPARALLWSCQAPLGPPAPPTRASPTPVCIRHSARPA